MENDLKDLKNLKDLCRLVVELQKIKKCLRKRKKRSCCVKEVNRDRNKKGYYNTSFLVIKENDPAAFFEHTRMNLETFNLLLNLLRSSLTKTSMRKPIAPEQRLVVTLTYLSQGISIQNLAKSFKLGKETVRKIVLETCVAIWTTLSMVFVCDPTSSDCEKISDDFLKLWNMPNCVGSLGGKHIAIRRPLHNLAEYFNYKDCYSIILMAACDAKYTFTYVDVGAYGGNNDEGAFLASSLGKRIRNKTLTLPAPKTLSGIEALLPHFFVADAAFPLAENIMKPFPGSSLPPEKEMYNKRLSRAWQTIENAFGILVARWRILLDTLHLEPCNAEKVVLACIALHNFIMLNGTSKKEYCSQKFVDYTDSSGAEYPGEWRSLVGDKKTPSIKASNVIHRFDGIRSTNIRNTLCEYFFTINRKCI